MSEQMEFPITFERFAKEYGFKDDKEVYTNGSDLIPIFRVKQWLEQDNKLRIMEIDTAYECGKHANKWISVSERLPEIDTANGFKASDVVLVCLADSKLHMAFYCDDKKWRFCESGEVKEPMWDKVIAWQPLPQPYRAESEE